ncbi:hypothetical protein [Pseudomonas atagonensis]|uniref:hypothetical protein n=1 Tax=Pseudomonas atagonensis TaxID=2609964 RepID=UPI00140722B8|nr:hypothetical protein [Pseudomonas atagonensis]
MTEISDVVPRLYQHQLSETGTAVKFFAPKPHSASTLIAASIRRILTDGVNR